MAAKYAWKESFLRGKYRIRKNRPSTPRIAHIVASRAFCA
jgi:hypothetical protein